MSRKQWAIYWIGICSILALIQILHIYNYLAQPSLGELYTGKTVVYSACVFILCGLIFISANIYLFIACTRKKRFSLLVCTFVGTLLFLTLSETILSKIAEILLPLNVWDQSTLKEIQSGRNQKQFSTK